MGPVSFASEWSRNFPAGSGDPFRREITKGNKPAPWTSANCFFLARTPWCSYCLKPLQTWERERTFQTALWAHMALTARWISISPLFKVAKDYRQKGFWVWNLYLCDSKGKLLYLSPVWPPSCMASSSTSHGSAIAMLASALVLSHPAWMLKQRNTGYVQDLRTIGLLNSSWLSPSLFLCQPWPTDQAFHSGYCSGNATLGCESTCWSQGLEKHKFIRFSTGLRSDRLTHRWIKGIARMAVENVCGRVFPGPLFSQARHP